MSDIIKSFPCSCSTPKGRVFGHFIANLKKISCHIVDKDDLYSLYFSLSTYYMATMSFQIRNKVPNDPAWNWKDITRQISYYLWQLMQWWPSAHILFQFRLKLRTYITLSVLKKYVQILGNTMKMALYASKSKVLKKKPTWLKKTIQILNYHCSISSNLVHCVMCINLEICKNEL